MFLLLFVSLGSEVLEGPFVSCSSVRPQHMGQCRMWGRLLKRTMTGAQLRFLFETQKGDTCLDSMKLVYLEVETGSELGAFIKRHSPWSPVLASFLLCQLFPWWCSR